MKKNIFPFISQSIKHKHDYTFRHSSIRNNKKESRFPRLKKRNYHPSGLCLYT